jgi:hypothetical protein
LVYVSDLPVSVAHAADPDTRHTADMVEDDVGRGLVGVLELGDAVFKWLTALNHLGQCMAYRYQWFMLLKLRHEVRPGRLRNIAVGGSFARLDM